MPPFRRNTPAKTGVVSPVCCELKIKAAPNAAKNAVAGRIGDAWKIRIHAPPEDGKANKALADFLAQTLDVPRNAVELTAGGASREKRLRVTGLTAAQADARLQAQTGAAG